MLNYGKQKITIQDKESVLKTLKSDFLTTGPKIQQFEKKLKKNFDSKYVLSCSNGTSALFLLCKALNINSNSEVFVPSITFVATASAAKLCGAKIILTDVCPDTGLMRKQDIEKALKKSTKNKKKFLFLVHLYGQTSNIEEIILFKKKKKITLIDDACHAIGTKYYFKKKLYKIGCSRHFIASTFSFHPVKNITTGEGGAISTNNVTLYRKMKLLRSHGINRSNSPRGLWKYSIDEISLNHRLSDIHASLGISQLNQLKSFYVYRSKIRKIYNRFFSQKLFKDYLKPVDYLKHCKPFWHIYALKINFNKLKIDKEKLFYYARKKNIGLQVHYIPLYRFKPFFQKKLANSELFYNSVLSIPFHSNLTNKETQKVMDFFKKVIIKYSI